MGNIAISSTESTLSDSEFDSCDLHDIKFIPNVSTFVLESRENVNKSHLKKVLRTKCEHKSIPFSEEHVPSSAHGTLADKSNTQRRKETLEQDYFLRNYGTDFCSRDDAFNTGRLLPEFPELRDSYDQFCTTLSEHSSRDDLDGKLSNRGSGMSVISELKSARGMRDSRYSSDETLESVHACKRRRKMIEDISDSERENHRWSMPEFTKLWHDNCESDPDFYLRDQYDSILRQSDGRSYSEQSTQTSGTPVLDNMTLTESSLEYLSTEVIKSNNTNIEEQKSSAKEKVIIGESTSCPKLVSAKTSPSYGARDYDSSGFYEDSSDDSSTSSSMHSRTSVNTIKENPKWHGYKPNLKDSGIYANEDLDKSASVNEINVYASDSGYSGISNGARDSPEGEETNLTQIKEKHVEILSKCKDCTNDDDFDTHNNDHVCYFESHSVNDCGKISHDNAHLKSATLCGEKGKRCAQLMQEYMVNRTLDTYTPSSSFYRTSAV